LADFEGLTRNPSLDQSRTNEFREASAHHVASTDKRAASSTKHLNPIHYRSVWS
jgi:hypothetical protein